MAASVAGSEAPNKRRRLSRTVQKEEKQVLTGLSNIFEDDDNEDLQYIISELSNSKKHHVPRVARLLRKGLLDKLDLGEAESEELGPKVTKYKHLKHSELASIVCFFEPQADKDAVKSMSRSVLLKWVCYSLHVKESVDLPSTVPTLRVWGPLKEYLKLAYTSLGARLSGLVGLTELDDTTIHGHFSLDVDNNRITCNTELDENRQKLSFDHQFGDADDWTVEKGLSVEAILKSESLDSYTKLRGRLSKACGRALPPENGENWQLPDPLPQSIIAPPSTSNGSGAAGSSAAPPPPPGSGKAMGKGRGATAGS